MIPGHPQTRTLPRGGLSMPVSLSEKAAVEVKKIITEQNLPEETVLRVGVQGGGCSGFSYSLNFDSSVTDRDRVVEFHGVKLAVEKKFDPYLDGTVVDFYDGLEKRGFVFNNPNVVKSCGCGSSFQV
jgi:iron-sulfur cluster assembly protein